MKARDGFIQYARHAGEAYAHYHYISPRRDTSYAIGGMTRCRRVEMPSLEPFEGMGGALGKT